MRIYMAARYSRRDELREKKEVLEKLGLNVTSRWLEETNPLDTQMGDDTTEFYIETANIDLIDIDLAEAVLFFSEDPLVGIPRGGRHVEFGYALGTKKPIYVVGPRENVFHYIDRVYHFDTFEDFIEAVKLYVEV